MKNLLLIILFIPILGYGQTDKLILSSGDTLMVNIIEVGVNEIKYIYPDEDLNYSIYKKKVLKIIHDSGRVEIINSRLSNKLDNPDKKKLIDFTRPKFNTSFVKNLNLDFFSGANANYINYSHRLGNNVEDINLITLKPIYGFNSKYIDVGWELNNSSDEKIDMIQYELNNSLETNGGFIDLNIGQIIWPNKSHCLFIRRSTSSYKRNIETWGVVEEYSQLFTLGDGTLVPPNTLGAVPIYDANGLPIMGFQEINQVLLEQNQWRHKGIGIGYSLNKKYLNYEIIILHSTYETEWQAYNNETLSVVSGDNLIKSVDVQICISLKLGSIMQYVLK